MYLTNAIIIVPKNKNKKESKQQKRAVNACFVVVLFLCPREHNGGIVGESRDQGGECFWCVEVLF